MRPRVRSGAVIVRSDSGFRTRDFVASALRKCRRPGRAGGNRDAGTRHRRGFLQDGLAASAAHSLSGAPTDMFRSGARSVARAIAARCAVTPGAASATASDALAAASRASRAAVPGEGSGASRRSAGLGASFDRGFARASAPARGHGHGHGAADADAETITVTFNEKDGSETVVQVRRDAAAPRGGATQIPRFSGADLPLSLIHI